MLSRQCPKLRSAYNAKIGSIKTYSISILRLRPLPFAVQYGNWDVFAPVFLPLDMKCAPKYRQMHKAIFLAYIRFSGICYGLLTVYAKNIPLF